MTIKHMLSAFFVFFAALTTPSSFAQTSYGAEIVSYQTFGEGLMVTRAKMAPISGTVSNIFFYNRADEPWNGNVWYEYDWELRGAYPYGGWSQIRVRENSGEALRDAPVNVSMTENIGEKFLHYVLIRQDDLYIYDVREQFDISTYDYSIASSHGENSASIIEGGARVFQTGTNVGHIPLDQRLDFSLGITAFDNNWAGALPNDSYSGDYVIDFTRFYEFSDGELKQTPEWNDEFNEGYLDYSKWFPATWTFHDTQFTTDNIRFENGYMILTADRGESDGQISGINLAAFGEAEQSTTTYGGEASRAIDGNSNGVYRNASVSHTANEANAWWEVELAEISDIDQIVIYNRTDCCTSRLSDFSVSVLDENDNVVWTRFYTQTPESTLTIDLEASGKKVKINLNGILSLAEVEVYGSQSAPLNLALLGTASQSTLAYGGEPERAIDNNTSGVWRESSVTHTENVDDSWWQVELAQQSDIEEIIIFNRTDCCTSRLSDFTVSILNENGDTIWSQFYSDTPTPSLSIDVDASGKVVKVSRDGTLSLAEVQVLGTQ